MSDQNNAREFLRSHPVKHISAIDEPPASPHSFDDEFDNGVISGWTSVYAGTAPTWVEDHNGLQLTCAAEAGWNLKGQLKAIPTGDWEIVARAGDFDANPVQYSRSSLMFVTDGAANTANVLLFGRAWDQNGVSTWSIGATQLTSFSTFSVTRADLQNPDYALRNPLYTKIAKSGTTYTLSYSLGGRYFTSLYSAGTGTFGFTPTHIGVGGSAINATYGIYSSWQWIRKTA